MKNSIKVLCIVLALMVFTLMAMGSGSKSNSNVSVETNADSIQNANDKESEVSKQKNNTIHIGEALNADGLKISFEKAEDYVSDNQFLQPESGNKYVRFYFSIVNESGSDKGVGAWDFKCYADGDSCESAFVSEEEELTSYTTLSDGRSTKGYVYYEVPSNASLIEIEYETSFWTNEKAIFVYEMN